MVTGNTACFQHVSERRQRYSNARPRRKPLQRPAATWSSLRLPPISIRNLCESCVSVNWPRGSRRPYPACSENLSSAQVFATRTRAQVPGGVPNTLSRVQQEKPALSQGTGSTRLSAAAHRRRETRGPGDRSPLTRRTPRIRRPARLLRVQPDRESTRRGRSGAT
jgi:hypothetical protein